MSSAKKFVARRIVTCAGADDAELHARLGVIEHGALIAEGDQIKWIGSASEAPACADTQDFGDAMILPGLVDPHTHLPFAGSRVDEFDRKMRGEDYRAIAASGGGILSTVNATRAASDDELYALASMRAHAMRELGTTCIEIKSGYGLTLRDELRLLRVGRKLAADGVVRTSSTLLAAHAVPPEYTHDRDAYISLIAREMIPLAAQEKLADSVDVYLDANAFSAEEAQRIFGASSRTGLRVRAHVGQFADVQGAELVAQYGGLSCDHLEHVSDEGLAAMARANVCAVLLPGAWRTLRQAAPDAARMRKAGVRIAIGTDCNPGTSPCVDLWMCAALAVRDAGLLPEEAILGVTVHAASAIGRNDVGALSAGKKADFGVYASLDARSLVYALGGTKPSHLFIGAERVPASGQVPLVW